MFSLGAAIAGATRAGAHIEVLTVMAADPASETPAGPWDDRSWFLSEGHAARLRRKEDAAACAILGAKPQWLPYGDEQYDRHGGEKEIHSAVSAIVAGADSVLIPGFPLANPDHAWLSELLIRRGLPCGRLGLYVEQPYTFTRRWVPDTTVMTPLQPLLKPPVGWTSLPTEEADRRAKFTAMRAYRSQLRQLSMSNIALRRLLRYEVACQGEAIAWLTDVNRH